MSWGRFSNVVPTYRVSITIDSTASASAADAQILIPDTFTAFWDAIDASGNELRVTAADGVTLLVYQLASFNKTNRTGYIQIDNFAPAEAKVCQVWLYYGLTPGTASGAGSFVYSASKTGYIYLGQPGSATRSIPERPGETQPRDVLSKTSAESVLVWFDFGPRLQARITPADGYFQFEEVYSVVYDVQLATVSQAAMITATSPKIVAGRFVQLLVGAGTSGSDYTVICTVNTRHPPDTAAQTLQTRAIIKVRNPVE